MFIARAAPPRNAFAKPGLLAGDAEVLAGEAADNRASKASKPCCGQSSDIRPDGCVGQQAVADAGFEDFDRALVLLAVEDGADGVAEPREGALDANIEHAASAEEADGGDDLVLGIHPATLSTVFSRRAMVFPSCCCLGAMA